MEYKCIKEDLVMIIGLGVVLETIKDLGIEERDLEYEDLRRSRGIDKILVRVNLGKDVEIQYLFSFTLGRHGGTITQLVSREEIYKVEGGLDLLSQIIKETRETFDL